MTTIVVDGIPIVISLFALGHSIVKARRLDNNLKTMKDEVARSSDALTQSSITAMGALEASLRSSISLAEQHLHSLTVSMPDDLPEGDKKWTLLMNAAMETVLNAYEEACSQYRGGRVDPGRFKKDYHYEVRQLVEDSNHKIFFDPVSSRYKAILAVYKEWNDLENS